MKNIAGIFETRVAAEAAVTELAAAGLPQANFSLIMTDAARDKTFVVGRDESGEAAKGGVEGALIGGAFGGIIAGLTAIGSIVVPGSTLLFAGPIVAALSGAAVGATAGGLVGALVSAGMPEEEAKRYEAELKAGKALLVVHPENEQQATIARTALIDNGALMPAVAA